MEKLSSNSMKRFLFNNQIREMICKQNFPYKSMFGSIHDTHFKLGSTLPCTPVCSYWLVLSHLCFVIFCKKMFVCISLIKLCLGYKDLFLVHRGDYVLDACEGHFSSHNVRLWTTNHVCLFVHMICMCQMENTTIFVSELFHLELNVVLSRVLFFSVSLSCLWLRY